MAKGELLLLNIIRKMRPFNTFAGNSLLRSPPRSPKLLSPTNGFPSQGSSREGEPFRTAHFLRHTIHQNPSNEV